LRGADSWRTPWLQQLSRPGDLLRDEPGHRPGAALRPDLIRGYAPFRNDCGPWRDTIKLLEDCDCGGL